MKFPVTYKYQRNGNYFNADPDYDVVYKKLHEFLKANHMQFKFVREHGFQGDYHKKQAFWNITQDTLYFYRTQDRNLFLLQFGDIYQPGNVK